MDKLECVPAIKNYDFLSDLYKGYVKVILQSAYEELVESTDQKLEILVKPHQAVVAKVDIKAKELKLVPLTTSVAFIEQGKSALTGTLVFGHVFDHPTKGTQMVATLSPAKSVLPPSPEPPLAIPYWLVKLQGDMAQVNLEPGIHKVVVSCQGNPEAFAVPILTNSKALKAGEELQKYKPSQAKRDTGSLPMAPPAKSAKTAKR